MTQLKHLLTLLLIVFLILPATGAASTDNHEGPALLSGLGSRFTVIPEPGEGKIRILPLGRNFPELSGLTATLKTSSGSLVFPDRQAFLMEGFRFSVQPSSLLFTMPVSGSAAEFQYELISPFCPGLPRWRSSPVMILRLGVLNQGKEPLDCRLAFDPAPDQAKSSFIQDDRVLSRVSYRASMDPTLFNAVPVTDQISKHLRNIGNSGKGDFDYAVDIQGTLITGGSHSEGWIMENDLLGCAFTVPGGSSITHDLVVCFYTGSQILNVDGNPCPLLYTRNFDSPETLFTQTMAYKDILLEDTGISGDILLNQVDCPELEMLICLAFQNFLANTWLVLEPSGELRYSEWEGFPFFHSTLDVVFNTSLFHLMFTPDLLGNLLKNWPRYGKKGHMPHDMGKGLVIKKNAYPVPMIVENDANYMLIHLLYANFTGDRSLLFKHTAMLNLVVQNLIAADNDGNGLPDEGMINTFDDAPSSVNSSENQIYLGLKVYAALKGYMTLYPDAMPADLKETAGMLCNRILSSVIDSWKNDHFPVYLASQKKSPKNSKTISEVLLPYDKDQPHDTGKPNLDTPDGYNSYAAHGLVPLFISGVEVDKRLCNLLTKHLAAAHDKTNTLYGDAHRDGSQNVWISQNMWRDLAATYLDASLDIPALQHQYWQFQLEAHARRKGDGRWEGFCDSPFNSYLTYYSRGIPSLFYPWANLHFSYSRKDRLLILKYPGEPGRVWLPILADWSANRIPALVWDRPGVKPSWIENRDLLEGITIRYLEPMMSSNGPAQ